MRNRIIDLRCEQKNPPEARQKFKLYKGKVLVRSPFDIDGIVIHQTNCVFGPKRGFKDPEEGRHYRALGVACHALALSCGHAVIPNPLEWYIYHGNKLNSRSLGLEIEGIYSPQGTDDELSPNIIAAAVAALDFLVEEGGKLGMKIRYIWAHRQSSRDRRGDPGGSIWKEIVLGYAVPQLGLKTEPDLVVGDGRPIPVEWDPNGKGHI
uniref:N-acetylmuramoyl-L-alanine amidase n=1 Tax=Dictyoglomus turgidum TaxID=513050 RepID=A0A7C3WW05_9BACT